MIDHVSLSVRNLDAAVAFFKVALAPLGYTVLMEFPGAVGLGKEGKPDLWLAQSENVTPVHLALAADRDEIDGFYHAALSAGGKDNGAPGLRPDYHPNYYAAFVHDADGHNIECVSHGPPAAPQKAPARKAAKKKAAPKKAAAKKMAAKATAKKAAKKTPAKKTAKATAKKAAKKTGRK